MRSELALYVSTAEPPTDEPRSVMFPRSSSVHLPYLDSDDFYIHGEPIRLAREPAFADGLSATDKDLALRIRKDRPIGGEWLAFEPVVSRSEGSHRFEQRREGPFFGA